MSQEISETMGKIRELCQRSIVEGEFSYDHNDELATLCAALTENPNFDQWIPLLFELVEEFDSEVDLTLGSPGPIVHELEATAPKYEEYLIASLARKPTNIGVSMATIISQSPGTDKDFWVQKINDVLSHPETPASLKSDIEILNSLS